MQYDYAKEGLLVVTVSSKLGNGAVVGDIVDFLKQIQIKSNQKYSSTQRNIVTKIRDHFLQVFFWATYIVNTLNSNISFIVIS